MQFVLKEGPVAMIDVLCKDKAEADKFGRLLDLTKDGDSIELVRREKITGYADSDRKIPIFDVRFTTEGMKAKKAETKKATTKK